MSTLIYAAQVDTWHHYFQLSFERSLRAVELAIKAADPRSEIASRYWASLAARTLGDMEGLKNQTSVMLEPAERLRVRYWLASAYATVAHSPFFEGDMETARSLNDLGLTQMPLDPRVLLHRVVLEAMVGD